MYGIPVLLSGMAALCLNSNEMDIISQQHKSMLCNLQKLPPDTPAWVIHFLAGQLPSSAQIHLKQLSLLGMLLRLGQDSVLSQIGQNILSSPKPIRKSWFLPLRNISRKYDLPDPSVILQSPPSKDSWKSQCRSQIISWWEQSLLDDVLKLPSLLYFKPNFMSLSLPHSLWRLAESPFEVL